LFLKIREIEWNPKNINILNLQKNSINKKNKMLLKKRYRIELTNNKLKQYKRINIRYDKSTIKYINYVYLVIIDLLIKEFKKYNI